MSNVNDDVVKCSGFMTKKGADVRFYLRRWFEIRGNFLFYYKNERSSGEMKPKGFIPLSGAEIDTSRISKLKIKIDSKFFTRTYELKVDNAKDYEMWVKAMKAVTNDPNRGADAVEAKKEIEKESKNNKVLFDRQKSVQGGSLMKKGSTFIKRKKEISLNDFEILVVVGRGSFGKVMKVRDLDTGEIFAMKAIKKSTILESNMIESTKNEQLIMRTIRHPFIVALHYAFQTPERLYLVQDFLSGGELFWHLQQDQKFSMEKARFYSAEIFMAIEHLHNNDIIYRDLKPENIVLDQNGHAVLTDFGLSKTELSSKHGNQTYTFCGTPEYLAPGAGHGKEVDWWSFGIMVYAFLMGHAPFYSDNTMKLYQMIMTTGRLAFPETLAPEAKDLITKLLDRDPETRLNAAGIRNHPFYQSIDWDKLELQEITPPFIPDNSDNDTKYFDTMFTDEDVRSESIVVAPSLSKKQHDDFDSMAYVRSRGKSVKPPPFNPSPSK
ncbi:serine/threonine-protein kinase [Acrasis kona]|uniref:Serine/threonine-protein kinase n=1 Tax=Acrasis kona TaxID=1008807 RepID=A0AAW2YHD1_9EUKA